MFMITLLYYIIDNVHENPEKYANRYYITQGAIVITHRRTTVNVEYRTPTHWVVLAASPQQFHVSLTHEEGMKS